MTARSSYTCLRTYLLFFEYLRVLLLADSTILFQIVFRITPTILVFVWILPAIFPWYLWQCQFLLFVVNLFNWTFLLHNVIVEWGLILGLLFFFFLNIFFRVVNNEKFLLGFHFATDEAAVESSIPFLLILLWLKLHVYVKPLLVFLDSEHNKDVRLSVVVYIFDFVQFDWFKTLSLINWIIQSELIGFKQNQTLIEFVNHDIQIRFWNFVFEDGSRQYFAKIFNYCVFVNVL